MTNKIKIMYLSFFILAIITFIVLLLYDFSNTYKNLFLLPLAFLIAILFLYLSQKRKLDFSLTVFGYVFLSFLRLVLLPLIGSISGYYNITPSFVNVSSINLGILLMIVEHFTVSIFIFFLNYKFSKTSYKHSSIYKLYGSKIGYIAFVFIAFLLFVFLGRNLNLFSFVFISLDQTRVGDIADFDSLWIRSFISYGIDFLYILLIVILKNRFIKFRSKKYYYLSVILSMVMIFIIVGERRSSQIYTAFAVGFILYLFYPKQRKTSIRIVFMTMLITLFFMTIYKSYNAFLYDSYTDVISNLNIDLYKYSSILDSNFFGPNVIGRNLSNSTSSVFSFQQLSYDFFRSIFGLSQLLKSYSYTTTQLYNLTIYNGASTSGYLYSSIAYGYYYFGFVFSYIFSFFSILIAFYLESRMKRTKYIEFAFLWTILFARSIMTIYSEPTTFINYSTRYFVIFMLVVLTSRFIKLLKIDSRSANKVYRLRY